MRMRRMMMAAASSAIAWEDVVSGLSPLVWLKMNEANETDFETNGNHGSDGGTLAVVNTGVTFGEPAIMPSEPTRTTTDPGTGTGSCRLTGLTTTLNSTAAIYFIYKGTTGASVQIAWRDCNLGAGGGSWFLQFNNTNVNFRIRGSDVTTTYASSNIKDGNPHLIGLAISASDASLWVDGVEVWTGSLGGSTATRLGWQYMSNSIGSYSQKLYGDFGDFVVFGSTLTDTEHEDLYAAFSGT